MLTAPIQDALNHQIAMEAQSSQAYLAMASWAEIQPGLDGVTTFFYQQSQEEREHMLKLIRYVNERGGFAIVPALAQPVITFQSLQRVFQDFLHHEIAVSANDKLELVGDERSGIYLFDKDILLFRGPGATKGNSSSD
jgi:ferritin